MSFGENKISLIATRPLNLGIDCYTLVSVHHPYTTHFMCRLWTYSKNVDVYRIMNIVCLECILINMYEYFPSKPARLYRTVGEVDGHLGRLGFFKMVISDGIEKMEIFYDVHIGGLAIDLMVNITDVNFCSYSV